MKQSVDIFESISPGQLSLHVMLNLQDAYADARRGGTPMPQSWYEAYVGRVKLRVELLVEFAVANALALHFPYVKASLDDVEPEMLQWAFDTVLAEKQLAVSAPKPKSVEPGMVILMCGGPGSGKSEMIKNGNIPEGGIILTRDAIFPRLSPYNRLQKEAPNSATHTVVTEAILYNERDRYRYALLSQANFIMVDSTLSYTDLGRQMIRAAQRLGYMVEVLHVDTDIEIALKRAEARAAITGVTINPKLLIESHVRCAANFFSYMQEADFTENWDNNHKPEDLYKFGSSFRMPLPEVQESTYRVSTRFFKYPQIIREGGVKQVDNHRLELIHLDEVVIVYMIRDVVAYNKLLQKSQMPLKDVSWPPDFDTVIAERLLHTSFLEAFK